MRVPAGAARSETTVKRSRFIAEAWNVTSRDEVSRIVSDLRGKHSDASHVVSAFLIGDERSELLGMSDDGEPHGTAGRPVLEVLRGSGVADCLVTVVRYFGGTKLGTGGLVHAYSDAARECLAILPTQEKRDLRPATIRCPYEFHRQVRTILDECEAVVVDEDFGSAVTVRLEFENGSEGKIQDRLNDVSRGTIVLGLEE
jgi:uncharacterized YigZ family protein